MNTGQLVKSLENIKLTKGESDKDINQLKTAIKILKEYRKEAKRLRWNYQHQHLIYG